jgi:glycosyltransferase involved in cell wall biosynthesis
MNERMRVLMLGWELPPYNSGGLGVACLGLAKALSNKGAKLTFVLPRKHDFDYDFMDIVFADIEEDSELIMSATYSSCFSWFRNLSFADSFPSDYVKAVIKYAKKVGQIAKKYNVDIIHAHDWLTYGAGIAAKKALKKPLVAHIHNTVFDRGAGKGNPYEYGLERKGFEEADRIVAISDWTRNMVIDKYGINKDKIDVVYNGVDTFTKKDLVPALMPLKDLGYKIVLSLGRITIQKGLDYFIQAAKKVLDVNPKVVFVVVGSGDMQEQIMTEAHRLEILDKIIFTGWLRGDEKEKVRQAADVFVMPSVSEPFGLVALEAVASDVPVIISKQSGVSEIFKNALKVDFWDIDEMANKILSVLEHKALRGDLKREGKGELKRKNLSWSTAADKCIGVYRQLL